MSNLQSMAAVIRGSSGAEGAGNAPPQSLLLCSHTSHIICSMSAQSFSQPLSHYPPAATQIIYLPAISVATPPDFYQPDAVIAASEGLNESNPVQMSMFHLDVRGQEKCPSQTLKSTVTLTLTCSRATRQAATISASTIWRCPKWCMDLKWPFRYKVDDNIKSLFKILSGIFSCLNGSINVFIAILAGG